LTLPKPITSSQVVDLNHLPLKKIEEFERPYFPAPRPYFLKCWITQPNCHALGYVSKDLEGYGVIRKCFNGYKIGPLFAQSQMIAQHLFESLCSTIHQGPIYLDVPEPNQNALDLIHQYEMKPTFEVIRMYRNGTPKMDLNGIFGITSYEL